jgi:hypothetical protein
MTLLMFLVACAEEPCGQDPANSPSGLTLTLEDHPSGWGRESCVSCHPVGSYHQADCMDDVELDLEALDEVQECSSCHGDNGVEGDSA